MLLILIFYQILLHKYLSMYQQNPMNLKSHVYIHFIYLSLFSVAHVTDTSIVIILVKGGEIKERYKKMFWLTCAVVLYSIIEPWSFKHQMWLELYVIKKSLCLHISISILLAQKIGLYRDSCSSMQLDTYFMNTVFRINQWPQKTLKPLFYQSALIYVLIHPCSVRAHIFKSKSNMSTLKKLPKTWLIRWYISSDLSGYSHEYILLISIFWVIPYMRINLYVSKNIIVYKLTTLCWK